GRGVGARIGNELPLPVIRLLAFGQFDGVAPGHDLRTVEGKRLLNQRSGGRNLRRGQAFGPVYPADATARIALERGNELALGIVNLNLERAEDVALFLVVNDRSAFRQAAAHVVRVTIKTLLSCRKRQLRGAGRK